MLCPLGTVRWPVGRPEPGAGGGVPGVCGGSGSGPEPDAHLCSGSKGVARARVSARARAPHAVRQRQLPVPALWQSAGTPTFVGHAHKTDALSD